MRLQDRLGLWGLSLSNCAWFHGASMGEVSALLPVIRKYRQRHPSIPVLLTATSPTGLARASGEVDHARLLPFDSPLWHRLALRRINPQFFAACEVELWPQLSRILQRRNVRQYLINARMTNRSAQRFRRWHALYSHVFGNLEKVFSAGTSTSEELINLGVPKHRIIDAGNTKFDVQEAAVPPEQAAELKAALVPNARFCVVLGSLRPGEEQVWFPAITRSIQDDLRITFIVAPRHQEKFSYFKARLVQHKIPFRSWSEPDNDFREDHARNRPVLLLDTLGLLNKVYSFCNLAFVGGTLLDGYGGHNPLEPAVYGVCVALGPYGSNISELVEMLRDEKAYLPVANQEEAFGVLKMVHARDAELHATGRRGREVWNKLKGVSSAIVDALPPLC